MVIGFDGSRAFVKNRTGTENYSYQLLKALAKIDKKNKYIIYLRPNVVILRNEVTKDLLRIQDNSNKLRDPSLIARDDMTRKFCNGDGGVADKWPENFQFKVINYQSLWTQVGLSLQIFKDKLDVLFVPAHTLPIIRPPHLKTVITVHDLGSEYLPNLHQLKQRLYLSYMQKNQLKSATKIIAVSEATKKDLVKRLKINAGKIEVVYEGYDKDKFKVQISKIKTDQTIQKYNLVYQKYYLFIGTVQPRKNLERVIRAFNVIARRESSTDEAILSGQDCHAPIKIGARNDELKLIIVGGKGWMSDEIYSLPKKLGIEQKVKFLGYIKDEDLPVIYKGALAFIFPSLFEGFGLPILEAQACRCPVITSNTSSMPEVAGKGAIYVDPYSESDIVESMERVKGKGERGKLIQNGLENVKKFSWEKCASQTLNVFEEILSTKS